MTALQRNTRMHFPQSKDCGYRPHLLHHIMLKKGSLYGLYGQDKENDSHIKLLLVLFYDKLGKNVKLSFRQCLPLKQESVFSLGSKVKTWSAVLALMWTSSLSVRMILSQAGNKPGAPDM